KGMAPGGCGAPPGACGNLPAGSDGKADLPGVGPGYRCGSGLQLRDGDGPCGGPDAQRIAAASDRAAQARPGVMPLDGDGSVAVDAAAAGLGIDLETERWIHGDRD